MYRSWMSSSHLINPVTVYLIIQLQKLFLKTKVKIHMDTRNLENIKDNCWMHIHILSPTPPSRCCPCRHRFDRNCVHRRCVLFMRAWANPCRCHQLFLFSILRRDKQYRRTCMFLSAVVAPFFSTKKHVFDLSHTSFTHYYGYCYCLYDSHRLTSLFQAGRPCIRRWILRLGVFIVGIVVLTIRKASYDNNFLQMGQLIVLGFEWGYGKIRSFYEWWFLICGHFFINSSIEENFNEDWIFRSETNYGKPVMVLKVMVRTATTFFQFILRMSGPHSGPA